MSSPRRSAPQEPNRFSFQALTDRMSNQPAVVALALGIGLFVFVSLLGLFPEGGRIRPRSDVAHGMYWGLAGALWMFVLSSPRQPSLVFALAGGVVAFAVVLGVIALIPSGSSADPGDGLRYAGIIGGSLLGLGLFFVIAARRYGRDRPMLDR